MPALTIFRITRGYQSQTSLGSNSQLEPIPPVSIDLLNGAFVVETLSGIASYNPEFAALKASAVFSDPANDDGEILLSGFDASVNDTITLVANTSDPVLRAQAISQFALFTRAGRNFSQTEWAADPVYLELRPAGATDSQYALVTDVKIAANQDILYDADYTPKVTLVVRREPFWRMSVPPGDNPKRWTFFTRGRFPSNNPLWGPTEYYFSWYDLTNTAAIAGANSLIEKDIYPYDELGTSSTNYIDIPAEMIPGDAPALALVTITPGGGGGSGRYPVFVSRDTKRDYYPSVNSVIPSNTGVITGRRKRANINGGDCIIGGAWTVFADANGVFSNGSIANRYVLRHNNALVANNEVASWRIARIQWQGRYAVYVRARLVAGATTNLTLRVEAVPSITQTTPVLVSTPDVSLASTTQNATFLGVLDFTPNGLFSRNITGTTDNADVALRLVINKAAAVSVDLRVIDLMFIPIDEPNALIFPPSPISWSTVDPLAVDSTGLFSPLNGVTSVNGSATFIGNGTVDTSRFPQPYRGQSIVLEPGITNRLYINTLDPAEPNTTVRRVRVDIVPRVRGMRGS